MAIEIIGDALGAAARGFGRLLAWIAMELVADILGTTVQRTGRLVFRCLRPGREPGLAACIVVGLLFWVCLIGSALWWLMDFSPAAS